MPSLPPEDQVVKEIADKLQRLGMSARELADIAKNDLQLDSSTIEDILQVDEREERPPKERPRFRQKHRPLRYSEAKTILDTLDSYLSRLPKGEAQGVATTEILSATLDQPVWEVSRIMYDTGISQFPVLDGKKVIGILTEKSLLAYLLHPPTTQRRRTPPTKEKRHGRWERKEPTDVQGLMVKDVKECLERTPEYSQDISLDYLGTNLEHYYAILLRDGPELSGIVSRADILKIFFRPAAVKHGELGVYLTATFNAPAEQVWRAFTDSELVPIWWTPPNIPTTVDKLDVKQEGEWRFALRKKDGSERTYEGSYVEVLPNKRLVYICRGEGDPRKVTMDFEERNGKTRVTVEYLYEDGDSRDAALESGEEAKRFGRLEEYLRKNAAPWLQ